VIHVYFDKQGFYQHTQIKQYNGKRDETNFIELPCNPETEKLLRENVQDVGDFLKQLISSNQQLYRSAMQDAELIELELRDISQKFEKKSNQDYLKKANAFILAIKQVNRYSDSPHYDRRGLLVQQQINHIEEYGLKKEEEEKKFLAENKACSTKKNSFKTPHNKKQKEVKVKGPKNCEYDKILPLGIQLEALTKELQESPNDINLLIKKDEIAAEIRLSLLKISSDFESLKPNQKNILNTLSKNSEFNQGLIEIFKIEFWKGNIEGVKLLYPHIESLINFGFLTDQIFLKLVTTIPNNEEHESKLKIVLDFLYQESSQYRFILSSQWLWTANGDKEERYSSLLIMARQEENLFAFKLLLEHGMNPNDIGLLINNAQIPALFYITAINERKERCAYLEEALKFGAHYTCKSELIPVDFERTKHIAKLLHNKGETSRVLHRITKSSSQPNVINYLLDSKNIIDWCCRVKNFASIELFLPQLKFEDILYVFAILATKENISRRHIVPSVNVGCIVAKNIQDVERILIEVLDPTFKNGLYSILIFSKDPNSHIELIEKLACHLQNEIQRLTATNPDWLKKIFNDLYVTAKNINRTAKPHPLSYAWQFDACLYLLIYEPKPTVMTYQTIMQLYCYQADYVKNIYALNDLRYMGFYILAMNIAMQTCFSSDLMSTPIYKHTAEKLQKCLPDNYPNTIKKEIIIGSENTTDSSEKCVHTPAYKQ
jgi:hypothetical protein